MVEAFCAEHSEPINEVLYDWPSTKFEKLYEAYARRKVAEELSQRRSLEMAAIWGNSNYDNEKDKQLRKKIAEDIDAQYSRALKKLYSDETHNIDEEQEIDYDDPFFAAMKRGIERQKLPQEPNITDT